MEALRAVQDDVKQLMGPDGAVPSINGVGLDPSGPGNPAAPVEVMLSEPLGYRALRDGLVVRRPRQAPRVGTMTRSTAHGRRPLALTGGAACILVGIAGCSADDRSATPSATAVTTTTTDPTIAVTATAPTRRPLPARPSAEAFASALAESFEATTSRAGPPSTTCSRRPRRCSSDGSVPTASACRSRAMAGNRDRAQHRPPLRSPDYAVDSSRTGKGALVVRPQRRSRSVMIVRPDRRRSS